MPERRELVGSVHDELTLFARRARGLSQPGGLSLVAYTLLTHVLANPEVRPVDLAGFYRLDKSTVSRQLADLERLGLLERGAHGQPLRVTAAGRAQVRAATTAQRSALEARLQDWDDADVAGFADYLRRFNAG
jgi:DNA-binding MarR family transcriptional regulator